MLKSNKNFHEGCTVYVHKTCIHGMLFHKETLNVDVAHVFPQGVVTLAEFRRQKGLLSIVRSVAMHEAESLSIRAAFFWSMAQIHVTNLNANKISED